MSPHASSFLFELCLCIVRAIGALNREKEMMKDDLERSKQTITRLNTRLDEEITEVRNEQHKVIELEGQVTH